MKFSAQSGLPQNDESSPQYIAIGWLHMQGQICCDVSVSNALPTNNTSRICSSQHKHRQHSHSSKYFDLSRTHDAGPPLNTKSFEDPKVTTAMCSGSMAIRGG